MRKAQPAISAELHALLLQHSPDWRFRLAMILGRETISRNGSVRMLKSADIDFQRRTIRWRGEYQKDTSGSRGQDRFTPLNAETAHALREAAVQGIGEAWVFPSPGNATKPCSRL